MWYTVSQWMSVADNVAELQTQTNETPSIIEHNKTLLLLCTNFTRTTLSQDVDDYNYILKR